MKQWVYKHLYEPFRLRIQYIRAIIVYTFQVEMAYPWNNWGNVISTTVYVIAELLFIEAVYANVDTIAGYTQDEMLLFIFIGQLWAYYFLGILLNNLTDLIQMVNSGQLDTLLTKPLPHLFAITFRRVNIVRSIRDGIPPLVLIAILIDWSTLSFTVSDTLAAAIIFIAGLTISNVLLLLAVLPVFWIGDSNAILGLTTQLIADGGIKFPYEGWPRALQVFFAGILPVAITAGVCTSVLLQKLPATPYLILSCIITGGFFLIQRVVWEIAMRAYSSASS